MKTVIIAGGHKSNRDALSRECLERYEQMFADSELVQKTAASNLWSDINSWFGSPAYTVDHVFKLVQGGHLDLGNPKDLSSLCHLIEKQPALQEGVLSMLNKLPEHEPNFLNIQLDEHSSVELTEFEIDQERIVPSCQEVRREFLLALQQQRLFAEYLFRHCPKLVHRIQDPDVLKAILVRFVGAQSTLLAPYHPKFYQNEGLRNDVLSRFDDQDVLSVLTQTHPNLPEDQVPSLSLDHVQQAVRFFSQHDGVREKLQRLFTRIAEQDSVEELSNLEARLFSLFYSEEVDYSKLRALFLEFPQLFPILSGPQNWRIVDLLHNMPDDLGFLQKLSETMAGQQVVADNIADISLYLFRKYGEENKSIESFMGASRSELLDQYYHQFQTPNYVCALGKYIGDGLEKIARNELDYFAFTQEVVYILEVPYLRKSLPLVTEQLLKLLRYAEALDSRGKPNLFAYDPLVEMAIGLDPTLSQTIMQPVQPEPVAQKKQTITPLQEAFHRKGFTAYPYLRAAHKLKSWDEDERGFYYKLIDMRVNAFDAFLAVSQERYWLQLSKFQSWHYFFLRVLQVLLPTQRIKDYCERQIEAMVSADKKLHPIIKMGIEYHRQKGDETFQSYLLRHIGQVDDYQDVAAEYLTEEKRQESYDLWFTIATPEQVFELCNNKHDSPYVTTALFSNRRYMQNYLRMLDQQPEKDQLPALCQTDAFMEACSDHNLHNDNVFVNSNQALKNKTSQYLQEKGKLLTLLEKTDLDAAGLHCLRQVDEIMALAMRPDDPVWVQLTPQQLYTLYILDNKAFGAVFEQRADLRDRLLSTPEFMLKLLNVEAFRSDVEPKHLAALLSSPLSSRQRSILARDPGMMWRIFAELQFEDLSQGESQQLAQHNMKKIWFSNEGKDLRKMFKNQYGPNYKPLDQIIGILSQGGYFAHLMLRYFSDEVNYHQKWDLRALLDLLRMPQCDIRVLSVMLPLFKKLCEEPENLLEVILERPEILCLGRVESDFQQTLRYVFSTQPQIFAELIGAADEGDADDIVHYVCAHGQLVVDFLDTQFYALDENMKLQVLSVLYQQCDTPQVRAQLLCTEAFFAMLYPKQEAWRSSDLDMMLAFLLKGQANFFFNNPSFSESMMPVIMGQLDGMLSSASIAQIRDALVFLSEIAEASLASREYAERVFHWVVKNASTEDLLSVLADRRLQSCEVYFTQLGQHLGSLGERLFAPNEAIPVSLFLDNPVLTLALVSCESGFNQSLEQVGMSYETLLLLLCANDNAELLEKLASAVKVDIETRPFLIECHQVAPQAMQLLMDQQFGEVLCEKEVGFSLAHAQDETLVMLRQELYDNQIDAPQEWTRELILAELAPSNSCLHALCALIYPHLTAHLELEDIQNIVAKIGIDPAQFDRLFTEINPELERFGRFWEAEGMGRGYGAIKARLEGLPSRQRNEHAVQGQVVGTAPPYSAHAAQKPTHMSEEEVAELLKTKEGRQQLSERRDPRLMAGLAAMRVAVQSPQNSPVKPVEIDDATNTSGRSSEEQEKNTYK